MTLQLTIHHIFYLKFSTLRSMLHVHKNPTSNQESKMILKPCLFPGKQFSGNYFPNFSVFVCYQKSWSTENTFQSKKNLVWFPGKCFPFWLCLFSGKWFPGNHFPNFPVFVCHQKSWSMENTFQSKKNLAWFSGKCFPGKFGRKTLSGSCEKFRNVIIC